MRPFLSYMVYATGRNTPRGICVSERSLTMGAPYGLHTIRGPAKGTVAP